jgi:uncharacterized protein
VNDLVLWQYLAISLLFVWGGFVRSGLGFGGAALTLPLLLLVIDNPVIFLPVISIHLLVFGFLTVGTRIERVDYRFLLKTLPLILPFKLAGVIGLLNLPAQILTGIVYLVTLFYAFAYLFGVEFRSRNRLMDAVLLAVGGYISGTTLIGAPLMIAVYIKYVVREKLRETLFVLWIVLVVIKLAGFVVTQTDLQLIHQWWLFPCALIGHLLGLRFHERLLSVRPKAFLRVVGGALLVITIDRPDNQLSVLARMFHRRPGCRRRTVAFN